MTISDHRQPTRRATDFFISHVAANRAWAEWVGHELQACGYSTSIAAWDFSPGTNFVAQMERAIREADGIVLLLSPDYVASVYAQPEYAATMAVGGQEKRTVLPVKVRPCEMPVGLVLLGHGSS
jgi:TIR domain